MPKHEFGVQGDSTTALPTTVHADASVVRRCLTSDMVEVARQDGSYVFVDFDHTLFACNSTELFIASCRPSTFVAIIEFLVRRCIPWRLSRLPHWFRLRDYVCCALIIILCPWNIGRWRRAAPPLFAQFLNTDLATALRVLDPTKICIISFGLTFVIQALLRDSEWSHIQLVTTPMLAPWPALTRGKLALAQRHAGHLAIAESTFITDSPDDRDLLVSAKLGVLIEPQGETLRAAERLYLPMRYTAAAKYTASYVIDQFVLVELSLLVLSVSQWPSDVLNYLPAIAMLFLSTMCVYELGYYENDAVAALKEKTPTLTEAALRFRFYPISPGAWIWALISGAIGAMLAYRGAEGVNGSFYVLVLIWIAGLLLLRLVFHLYNKPDLRLRLHLYPVLQTMKFLPTFLLIRPTPIGASLITCQIATMWAIYLTYRQGGRTKDIEREFYRIILIILAITLMATTGLYTRSNSSFQIGMTFLWICVRLGKAPLLRAIKGRSA